MPTIPTGQLERELRKRYLRFISGITMDSANLDQKLRDFEAAQLALIESMGGRTAMLGALGDFPAPRSLDLSPWQGTVYSEMQTTAIQAGIIAGSSSKEAAQAMFRAGMDKSYRKLERLARTETTNAYWKNAWGSIADLPALVMLWGSEDGPRTCAWCRERDGMVISGSEVRDHPNGRCTPIPTLRSQVQYRGSVDRDGSLFNDPEWGKKSKSKSDSLQATRAELDKVVTDPRAGTDPAFNSFKTSEPRALRDSTIGANPGKVADPGNLEYSKNCTRVSAAVEMRARGYDVVAGKVPLSEAGKSTRNSIWDIDNNWVTSEGRIRESLVVNGEDALRKAMLSEPDGSRFFISGGWKQGGGHIWNAEVRDGKVIFLEGQSVGSQGKDMYDAYIARLDLDDLTVKRVDDLFPSASLKGYGWIVEEN